MLFPVIYNHYYVALAAIAKEAEIYRQLPEASDLRNEKIYTVIGLITRKHIMKLFAIQFDIMITSDITCHRQIHTLVMFHVLDLLLVYFPSLFYINSNTYVVAKFNYIRVL